MNFIKRHWFNILIILFMIICVGITLLAAFSPKEDKLERGFIPCTKQLSEHLIRCDAKAWCIVKTIVQNSACDANVIIDGVKLWVKGEQPAPWSNYFFEPEIDRPENTIDDEQSELFIQENPNYLEDFEQVKQEHKKLEEMNSNDKIEK